MKLGENSENPNQQNISLLESHFFNLYNYVQSDSRAPEIAQHSRARSSSSNGSSNKSSSLSSCNFLARV